MRVFIERKPFVEELREAAKKWEAVPTGPQYRIDAASIAFFLDLLASSVEGERPVPVPGGEG